MIKNYSSTQDLFVPDHNKIFQILFFIFHIHVYDDCTELESRKMKNEKTKMRNEKLNNEKAVM